MDTLLGALAAIQRPSALECPVDRTRQIWGNDPPTYINAVVAGARYDLDLEDAEHWIDVTVDGPVGVQNSVAAGSA